MSSFMANFTKNRDSQPSPSPFSPVPAPPTTQDPKLNHTPAQTYMTPATSSPRPYSTVGSTAGSTDEWPRVQRERSSSRPMSMIQTYQPPLMDVAQDTLPELQPIFTFLNSHGNKLYQEGYFLKLDDQDNCKYSSSLNKPSLIFPRWQAQCGSDVDGMFRATCRNGVIIMGRSRAGYCWRRWRSSAKIYEPDGFLHQDGKTPSRAYFMAVLTKPQIESLPTRSENEPPLQNVLSISTAGKNRYLFHFNSHHSLIQWTAGIRLAMFEHTTLQEAYTGALIAGKGKALNNINLILDRTRVKSEDWARVRFGAGTPWRRCWCVITPPDEKEVQKLQKELNKKRSAYDRSRPPVLTGDIKFYDSKKTKKVKPIATITDAYSAFAIYPQAKPLIDASTLVKVEGSITIHADLPSKSEGFVFVMPEVHPAVSGFEIMLRWLFPVFDTFALYGRPGRLIADTSDPQSLMFAMPKRRRYGYLETLDVAGLILEPGSSGWKECEWRRRMKDLTSKRMTTVETGSRASSRYSRQSTRNSFGPSRTKIQFDDNASIRSSPQVGRGPSPQADTDLPRTDSAPPSATTQPASSHYRSASETQVLDRFANVAGYDRPYEQGPPPPPHSLGIVPRYTNDMASTPERVSSEDEFPAAGMRVQDLDHLRGIASPEPVVTPPAFLHSPGTLPASLPYHSAELRRANSRMSNGTLTQMVGAAGASGAAAAAAYRNNVERSKMNGDQKAQSPGQYSYSSANNATSPEIYGPRPPPAGLMGNSQPAPQYSHITSSPNPNMQVAQAQQNSPLPRAMPLQTSNRPRTPNTSQLAQIQTSPARKPLPANSSIVQTPTSAQTESSNDSLGEHIIDQAAFDLIASPQDRKFTLDGKPTRSETATSIYPEDLVLGQKNGHAHPLPPMPDARYRAETATSSYSQDISRRQTLDPMPPMPAIAPNLDPRYRANTDDSIYEDDVRYNDGRTESRRTGVLRTVGNVKETPNGHAINQSNTLIPTVDFGPTYNLASGAGPRQQSPGRARGGSPGPVQVRHKDRSPGYRNPMSQSHSRSPNRSVITPDSAHYRSESGESRSIPWQPRMSGVGLGSPNMALTAEEFVQQRAAAVPLYAHQRTHSGNVLSRNTPTPPLGGQHSRHSSVDLLQRPRSRGASAALNQKQQQAQYQQHPEQMGDYRSPQQYGNKPPVQHADPSLRIQPPTQLHQVGHVPYYGNMPPPSPLYSPPPPQFFNTPQFLTQKDEHHNA